MSFKPLILFNIFLFSDYLLCMFCLELLEEKLSNVQTPEIFYIFKFSPENFTENIQNMTFMKLLCGKFEFQISIHSFFSDLQNN